MDGAEMLFCNKVRWADTTLALRTYCGLLRDTHGEVVSFFHRPEMLWGGETRLLGQVFPQSFDSLFNKAEAPFKTPRCARSK